MPVFLYMECVCILISSIGNVQSRLYLGLGRDGLLPSIFAKVHHTRHTPIHAQVWVGVVAGVMAGLFNVHELSHILSVGTLVRILPYSWHFDPVVP